MQKREAPGVCNWFPCVSALFRERIVLEIGMKQRLCANAKPIFFRLFFILSTEESAHVSVCCHTASAVNQAAYLTHMGSWVILPGSADAIWPTVGAWKPFNANPLCPPHEQYVIFSLSVWWMDVGVRISRLLPRTHLSPTLTGSHSLHRFL